RPFVSAEVVCRVVEGAEEHGVAYPGVPVTDTVRMEGELLERSLLVAAQTPQAEQVSESIPATKSLPAMTYGA
ncbi:MAG: 2-C-methyl-D-erythritol 4-phosphate cytidylyltransferase, partial [Planctomycetes bacterium]|nr:2-C-methyl-D-erythritol 4-phosphate cytidylyltransferase [Planctomycetota bacterium]